VPVHRALTEPILLGGAPRSLAILNGTLGLGLRLWLVGLGMGDRPFRGGLGGQARSAVRRRRRRHLRVPGHLSV
jgi:type IV secretion system protein VirB3